MTGHIGYLLIVSLHGSHRMYLWSVGSASSSDRVDVLRRPSLGLFAHWALAYTGEDSVAHHTLRKQQGMPREGGVVDS